MAQSVKATSEPCSALQQDSARPRRFAWAIGDEPDQMRSRWPEWGTLFCYAALVAFAIPYHEPWVDEAQAWQLARTFSLTTLFNTYIRYEGSPGLWYFLLWMMARIHIGYAGLHWICGAVAAAAIWLLLFRSPFPRYLKLSLPFTFFLLFQYAIVARSYVLVPLLLFFAAIVWKKSPFWIVLALGLLANTSLHAAVISGGLAAVYAIEQFRNLSYYWFGSVLLKKYLASLEGGQSCPQPPFRRLSRLESRLRPGLAALQLCFSSCLARNVWRGANLLSGLQLE